MADESSSLCIADDRLITEAVEINAVWHCNIRCQWCSHASPHSPPTFASVSEIEGHLRDLARFMRVDHLRVVGGEPLLHPDLVAMIEAGRSSGIAPKVRVLTNGLTLHRATSSFWQVVDEVHVSVYPSTRRAVERNLAAFQEAAEAGGTQLKLLYFDRFRVAYRRPGPDVELTERVYRTCQIGNVWRCLTVEAGRLYRCPQAARTHLDARPEAEGSTHGADYLEISRIGSAGEVLDWLRRPRALSSCAACAGSVGELRKHQQLRAGRSESVPAEIDRSYLELLERDPGASNSCVADEVMVWETK